MTELRKLQGAAMELEREAKRVRDEARAGSMLEGAMNHSVLPAVAALIAALVETGEILDAHEGAHSERDSAT